MPPLLEVRDLHVQFNAKEGVVRALNGVSFTINQGEVVGLLGESGAGKTVTALATMGLVPYPGKVVSGQVLYRGRDLIAAGEQAMRDLRAEHIAIAFQDPVASLNPRLTIGAQIQEVFRAHKGMSKSEARQAAVGLLKEVGMPDPERIMKAYTFQISGGMAQRVMLAIAISLRPPLLLADELTSNLDVTLQADMLQRLRKLRAEHGTAVLLISHDLGVMAQMADRIIVMYAGRVVEEAPVRHFYHWPAHPYSWGMLSAVPRIDRDVRLQPIRGLAPDLRALGEQCPFLPRCFKATVACRTQPVPGDTWLEDGHTVKCYNPLAAQED